MLRFGKICEINFNTGFARVQFDDDNVVSPELSISVPGAKEKKFSFPFDVNESVWVMLDEHGERGVIGGAVYNRKQSPQIVGGKFGVSFPGGNKIEYDPGSNKLTIVASGDVEIEGDVKVTGKIEATGQVTAMLGPTQVGLSSHIHVETSVNTQPPTPAT